MATIFKPLQSSIHILSNPLFEREFVYLVTFHVPSLFPGCQGGRGRGGNDDGNDGGVYRYDYDDLDIRPTSSSTTPGGIGRNRFVCLFKS